MTFKLYLDTRANKENAPIKLMLSEGGKTALISLGVRIRPDQWEGKVKDHPNADSLNSYLISKQAEYQRQYLVLAELGKTRGKNVSEIKKLLENKGDKRDNFVSRYEHYLSLKEKPKTIKGYKWTLSALREFDSSLDSKTFEDITTDYIKDFQVFCSRKLNRNSINIHLRYIRAVFNDAIDAGITQHYPFRAITVKPLPVRKKALTLEQLRTLFSYPCEPWQEQYRDMFKLMLYFRGINAVDLFSATLTQIVNGRLEYRRSKVGTLFSVKIEPEAWEIINRYKGEKYLVNPLERYKNYEDYLRHMNKALKSIGRLTGKRGKVVVGGMFPELSSNWARHSWATAGAALDIPNEVVSMGMGHSFGLKVTNIYIDFDMRKVDEANRKIIDALGV